MRNSSKPSEQGRRIASAAPPAVEWRASCTLPTRWASFQAHAFVETATGKEHVALALGALGPGESVLTRVHSECLTGDTLFSQRCDCGAQLETALRRIATAGRGLLLYLRQEGRGIGLVNKIRAYALQEQGADTVEANQALGFADDQRSYELCGPMLRHFGVESLDLMTNNPRKVDALGALGFRVHRVPLTTASTAFNAAYLATKASKLGHLLPGAMPEPDEAESG